MSADIIAFPGPPLPEPGRSGGALTGDIRFRAVLDNAQREVRDLELTCELSLLSAEAMLAGDLDRMVALRDILAERLKLRGPGHPL